MKSKTSSALASISLLALTAVACGAADAWKLPPETARLKPGPGVELATGQCLICHSADYVGTQPKLTRTAWDATVKKMREKYGAPIQPDQTNALVNYLVANYGRENPAPK